jgi:ligand-binding sensor domain-containing protein
MTTQGSKVASARRWAEHSAAAATSRALAGVGLALCTAVAACSSGGGAGSTTPESTPPGAEQRSWRSFSDMAPVQALKSTSEYLWVGTAGGLLRYPIDGGEPLRIAEDSGPGGQQIVEIESDEHGRVWALSEKGLGVYEEGAWSRPTGALPDVGTISALALTTDGTVWVGGSQGLVANGGTWVRWATDDDVTALAPIDGTNEFWVGTSQSGIWYVDAERMVSKHVRERGMPCGAIRSLVAGDGSVWALCSRGDGSIIARYDGTRWQGLTAKLPDRPVDLARCRKGVVLLTDSALWQVVERTGTEPAPAAAEGEIPMSVVFEGAPMVAQRFKIQPTQNVGEPPVSHLVAQPRGMDPFVPAAEAPSRPDGVAPMPPPLLKRVDVRIGEDPTLARCDERGIWVGTDGLGVTRIGRGGQVSHYRTYDLVITERPFTVAADDDGRAWFLTRELSAGYLENTSEGRFAHAQVEPDVTAGVQILFFASRGAGAYAFGRLRGSNVVRIYQHANGQWSEIIERELVFAPTLDQQVAEQERIRQETRERRRRREERRLREEQAAQQGQGQPKEEREGPAEAEPSVSAALVLADFSFFEVDPLGKFWIGILLPSEDGSGQLVPAGVAVIDLEVEEVTYHGERPSGPGAVAIPDDVNVVDFMSSGEPWLGGLHGVIVMRAGGALQRYDEATGLNGEVVNDLAIDAHGMPWVATPEGLGHYEDNTWRFFLDNQPEHLHVVSLAVDADGELWMGGNRGASHYDGERWEVFTATRGGLISNRIRSVHVDSQDRVWFVTDAGISMLSRH